MKASTFQTIIVGLLCLAVAGLSGGLFNQYQRMAELQSTNTQRFQTLDTLQRDLSALRDAQEKLQYSLKDLKQMVDTGEQQANTLDPMLDQWAQEIQEMRDGLAERATVKDLTALRGRFEHVEQQLLELRDGLVIGLRDLVAQPPHVGHQVDRDRLGRVIPDNGP